MIRTFVRKILGKVLTSSKVTRDASIAALASVAETLLRVLRATLAEDVRRLKNEFFDRLTAGTQAQEAEAQKKLAEAVDAANKVTQVEHEEAMRQFEREEKQIELQVKRAKAMQEEAKARKVTADAAEAELRKLQLIREVIDEARQKRLQTAEQDLLDSIFEYQQGGGKLLLNADNLKALLARACDVNPSTAKNDSRDKGENRRIEGTEPPAEQS